MQILSSVCYFHVESLCPYQLASSELLGKDKDVYGCSSSSKFVCRKGIRGRINALAGQKQTKRIKKLKKGGDGASPPSDDTYGLNGDVPNFFNVEEEKSTSSSNDSKARNTVLLPSRDAVLQACVFTSGFIGALGIIIRQVSHLGAAQGWPVVDCSTDITFSFEPWHLELVAGSVVLISSCRMLLLKFWRDFAESSEAANKQVLTSLEPLDYLVVAFLPGISEELLFRGALLPLFGPTNDWVGITLVAALFGILHLGSGRKYSFAIWATFVGIVYGYATILSSSVVVPMVSHGINNLVGGLVWRYSIDPSKQIKE